MEPDNLMANDPRRPSGWRGKDNTGGNLLLSLRRISLGGSEGMVVVAGEREVGAPCGMLFTWCCVGSGEIVGGAKSHAPGRWD